jgi:hypothetical protein
LIFIFFFPPPFLGSSEKRPAADETAEPQAKRRPLLPLDATENRRKPAGKSARKPALKPIVKQLPGQQTLLAMFKPLAQPSKT